MKILVLHGPNLNLIGLRSAKVGERVTLDKINKALRLKTRNIDLELKILQTHKMDRAITFLQRNRNLASGAIIAPMSWSASGHELYETLDLINLPAVQVLLSSEYSKYSDKNNSIFSEFCFDTLTGHPENVYLEALDLIVSHLDSTKS